MNIPIKMRKNIETLTTIFRQFFIKSRKLNNYQTIVDIYISMETKKINLAS